eukprot:COSAG01_NODE_1069_length_11875_cov_244.112716_5_plen_80_part_00
MVGASAWGVPGKPGTGQSKLVEATIELDAYILHEWDEPMMMACDTNASDPEAHAVYTKQHLDLLDRCIRDRTSSTRARC